MFARLTIFIDQTAYSWDTCIVKGHTFLQYALSCSVKIRLRLLLEVCPKFTKFYYCPTATAQVFSGPIQG